MSLLNRSASPDSPLLFKTVSHHRSKLPRPMLLLLQRRITRSRNFFQRCHAIATESSFTYIQYIFLKCSSENRWSYQKSKLQKHESVLYEVYKGFFSSQTTVRWWNKAKIGFDVSENRNVFRRIPLNGIQGVLIFVWFLMYVFILSAYKWQSTNFPFAWRNMRVPISFVSYFGNVYSGT